MISLWQRVAELKPTALDTMEFSAREIRGSLWYVAGNSLTGDKVRLNPQMHACLQRLDGTQTLASVCEVEFPDATESEQHALASAVITLSNAGMIRLNASNDVERLISGVKMAKIKKRSERWFNPLALRFAIINPDAWMTRVLPWLHWMLTRRSLLMLLVLVLSAMLLAITNAASLSAEFTRLQQSPGHWWMYLVLYPIIKFGHEFAHALAIKRFGGNVHEAGFSILVLMPVPFVDATDAWMFDKRRERLIVSAAGIAFEAVLASLTLLVWLIVEPGLIRDITFATTIITMASILLFNANPLLRFDGYYILQDAIDIPNLASRSTRYLKYLCKHYLFRIPHIETPVTAPRERRWLATYGVLAIVYRWFITALICIFLYNTLPLIGFFLSVFALYQLALKPLVKLFDYLWHSPDLEHTRRAATLKTAVGALFTVVLISAFPLPSSTRTEGVVWVPGQAEIYAAEDAELIDMPVQAGAWVEAGDVLFRFESSQLERSLDVLDAEIKVLEAERHASRLTDLSKGLSLDSELGKLAQQKILMRERQDDLTVRAKLSGRLALAAADIAVGAHVQAGTPLAFVVRPDELRVRAVIRQRDIVQVRNGVSVAQIRLAEALDKRLEAAVLREIPSGSHSLPSQALAYNGRSGIAVASTSEGKSETLEPVFHMELSLPEQLSTRGIGGRAYITLTHAPESLGARWWRATRQVLIKQLSV